MSNEADGWKADDLGIGGSGETPQAAYALMHARVRGQAPQPGDTSISAAQYDAARTAYLAERHQPSRKGVARWPPTSQTVMKQLGNGSWGDAVASLGLVSNVGRARGAGRFDDDDYRAVVAEFLTAAHDPDDHAVTSDSFGQFTTWLRSASEAEGNAPRLRPSAAAVRKHFGTWEAAKASANLHT